MPALAPSCCAAVVRASGGQIAGPGAAWHVSEFSVDLGGRCRIRTCDPCRVVQRHYFLTPKRQNF